MKGLPLILFLLSVIACFAQETRTLKCEFELSYSPSWPVYGHPSENGVLVNFQPSHLKKTGFLQNNYLGLKVGMFFGGKRTTFTQEYKKFRVGVGSGIASSTASALYLLYLEPTFQIKNTISIGARLEGGIYIPTSYGINGQYHFSTKSIRPFVGLGFGFYRHNFSSDIPSYSYSPAGDTKPGFYPRVGFDYGHFSFMVDYNFISPFKTTLYTYDSDHTLISIESFSSHNNYMGIKIGVSIGGGRKRVSEQ